MPIDFRLPTSGCSQGLFREELKVAKPSETHALLNSASSSVVVSSSSVLFALRTRPGRAKILASLHALCVRCGLRVLERITQRMQQYPALFMRRQPRKLLSFIASEAINGNARSGSAVGLMRSKNRAPETSAAFFCAQVKIESEPKPDHAQYFAIYLLSKRTTRKRSLKLPVVPTRT